MYAEIYNAQTQYKTPSIDPSRPKFSHMWKNFPAVEAEIVYKKIAGGDGVNGAKALYEYGESVVKSNPKTNNPYGNACALRMSIALNKSGLIISNKNAKGFYLINGENKEYKFIIRVNELIEFLKKQFGKPEYSFAHNNEAKVPKEIIGKKGVIYFKVEGWKDANGHVDMWNGNFVAKDAYFCAKNAKTTQIALWELIG